MPVILQNHLRCKMYYTNEELDQYVDQIKIGHKKYLEDVVPQIIKSLRKSPNNYLAFGTYWYHVKKVIQDYSSGEDWFYGDFHDQLIMEMSDHGDDFRNVVAALVYANETDYFSSSEHKYTWEGDPRTYILEDDDFLSQGLQKENVAVESVAVESVKIDFNLAIGKPFSFLESQINDFEPEYLSIEEYEAIQRDVRKNFYDKGDYHRSDYFLKKLNSAMDHKERDDLRWSRDYLKELNEEKAEKEKAEEAFRERNREEVREAQERTDKYRSDIKEGKSENYRYQAFLDTVENPSKITSNADYQAWMSSIASDFKEIHGNAPVTPDDLKEWQKNLDKFVRDYADQNLSSRLKSPSNDNTENDWKTEKNIKHFTQLLEKVKKQWGNQKGDPEAKGPLRDGIAYIEHAQAQLDAVKNGKNPFDILK